MILSRVHEDPGAMGLEPCGDLLAKPELNEVRVARNLLETSPVAKFRTLGPATYTTTRGYAVCPILEVTDEPPAPLTTEVVTFVVLDPDFKVVFNGAQAACIAEADALDLDPNEAASVPSGPA